MRVFCFFFSVRNVECKTIPPIQEIATVRLLQTCRHFTLHGRVISKTKVFSFPPRDGKASVTMISVYIEDMTGVMRLVFYDEQALRFVFSDMSSGSKSKFFKVCNFQSHWSRNEASLGIAICFARFIFGAVKSQSLQVQIEGWDCGKNAVLKFLPSISEFFVWEGEKVLEKVVGFKSWKGKVTEFEHIWSLSNVVKLDSVGTFELDRVRKNARKAWIQLKADSNSQVDLADVASEGLKALVSFGTQKTCKFLFACFRVFWSCENSKSFGHRNEISIAKAG